MLTLFLCYHWTEQRDLIHKTSIVDVRSRFTESCIPSKHQTAEDTAAEHSAVSWLYVTAISAANGRSKIPKNSPIDTYSVVHTSCIGRASVLLGLTRIMSVFGM